MITNVIAVIFKGEMKGGPVHDTHFSLKVFPHHYQKIITMYIV